MADDFNEIRGDSTDENLIGTDGQDDIQGGAGNDTIDGAGGDDILEGGAGDDIIRGGSGYNTAVYYAYESDFESISTPDSNGLITLTPSANPTVDLGTDQLYNIQAITFYEYNDYLGTYLPYTHMIDDFSNVISTDAPNVVFGQSLGGILNYTNDKDLFEVVVEEDNQTIDFSLSGSAAWRIVDGSGAQVHISAIGEKNFTTAGS